MTFIFLSISQVHLLFSVNIFFCKLDRYKGAMMEDVRRIFEAVFQCTLEVREMHCYWKD